MNTILLSLILVVLVTCPSPPDPHKGFDVVGPVTKTAFGCLAADGYTYAIVRADTKARTLDKNAITTLQNAKFAQLQTDIYLSLCPGPNVRHQVFSLVYVIPRNLFSTVWFKVVSDTPQCSWKNAVKQIPNCYLWKGILGNLTAAGLRVGIFITKNLWSSIMGADCDIVNQLQTPVRLWYANYLSSGLNSVQSTSDYSIIGGITQPDLKQIVGSDKVTLCSNPLWTILINVDWKP